MKKLSVSLFFAILILPLQLSWAVSVQWEVSEGGNGHWYEVIYVPTGITWTAAHDAAIATGGYLATITSAQENDFIWELSSNPIYWYAYPGGAYGGPYLGGYQDRNSSEYSEPAGGWRWATGEPWSYTNWAANLPDNSSMPNNAGREEDYLQFFSWLRPSPSNPTWNDLDATEHPIRSYVVEYNPVPNLPPCSFSLRDWSGLQRSEGSSKQKPPIHNTGKKR